MNKKIKSRVMKIDFLIYNVVVNVGWAFGWCFFRIFLKNNRWQKPKSSLFNLKDRSSILKKRLFGFWTAKQTHFIALSEAPPPKFMNVHCQNNHTNAPISSPASQQQGAWNIAVRLALSHFVGFLFTEPRLCTHTRVLAHTQNGQRAAYEEIFSEFDKKNIRSVID